MINLIPPQFRLAVALALLIGAFGAGAKVQGWRKDAEIAKLVAGHTAKLDDIDRVAKETAARNRKNAEARQNRLVEVDRTEWEALQDARTKDAERIACLERGDCRVFVRARCPTATGVPSPSDGSSVDTSAVAELDPTARRTYAALRESIQQTELTLHACQRAVAELIRRESAP